MPRTPVTAPDLLLEESFNKPSESGREAMPRRGHIVDGAHGHARGGKFGWKMIAFVIAVVALSFLVMASL